MKKKSASITSTWKPRLFVLRGRRLSYYYTESDIVEKGLIDISSHRVLPADNEFLTSLHATVTGAKSSPSSPPNAHTPTMNSDEAARQGGDGSADGMFIFKLVPPRTGLSRAVAFTKPAVHYFAVDNITQGRLWMAALMKATIDRDESKPVTTTYQQKTISLAKAKAMRQRPPALMNVDEKAEGVPGDESATQSPVEDESGLNIQGLNLSYEYLASEANNETSENGVPDASSDPVSPHSAEPNSAPLLDQAQQNATGGRLDHSNSLRMVRSLSAEMRNRSATSPREVGPERTQSAMSGSLRNRPPSSRIRVGSRAGASPALAAGWGPSD